MSEADNVWRNLFMKKVENQRQIVIDSHKSELRQRIRLSRIVYQAPWTHVS